MLFSLSFLSFQSRTHYDSNINLVEADDKAGREEFLRIVKIAIDTGNSMSDTAKNYLNSFFEIVDANSLHRDSIDFIEIKNRILYRFKKAQSIADCYPAIVQTLTELGDHHSFFLPYDQVKVWQSDTEENHSFQPSSGRLLQNEIGYVLLPSFNSGSPRKMQLFADTLQRTIESLDKNKVTGWIIDLRNNGGGNCWPMLAGIGPLLGEGVCGSFAGRNGLGPTWKYIDGIIYEGDEALVRVLNPYHLKKEFTRVAVLTGPMTASSGEVVVVSLIGKTNTKSFGEPTYGLSTGNQDFKLSDGSMLFLTTSVYVDRNKHSYGGKIVPDEIVPFSKPQFPPDNDPVVKKAIEWLMKSK